MTMVVLVLMIMVLMMWGCYGEDGMGNDVSTGVDDGTADDTISRPDCCYDVSDVDAD